MNKNTPSVSRGAIFLAMLLLKAKMRIIVLGQKCNISEQLIMYNKIATNLIGRFNSSEFIEPTKENDFVVE